MIRYAARAALERVFIYTGFLYFGVVGALYSLLSSVLYLVLPRTAAAGFGKRGIGFLLRVFFGLLKLSGLVKLDLSALDKLKGQRGIVIAPNHPCLLDALFVISRVPEVTCIMKAEIWDNPMMGGGVRLAGYIRNDSALNMVRLSAEELRKGHPLLIFPEGTRTRGKPINEFKGGFALIAKKAGAVVQTVFIETDSPFLSKGWPLFKKPQLPLVYRTRLGKRFTVEGDVKTFMISLQDYYRDELTYQPVPEPSPVLQPTGSPRPGPAA